MLKKGDKVKVSNLIKGADWVRKVKVGMIGKIVNIGPIIGAYEYWVFVKFPNRRFHVSFYDHELTKITTTRRKCFGGNDVKDR